MDVFERFNINMPKTTAEWLRKNYSEKEIALAIKETLTNVGRFKCSYLIAYLKANVKCCNEN